MSSLVIQCVFYSHASPSNWIVYKSKAQPGNDLALMDQRSNLGSMVKEIIVHFCDSLSPPGILPLQENSDWSGTSKFYRLE